MIPEWLLHIINQIFGQVSRPAPPSSSLQTEIQHYEETFAGYRKDDSRTLLSLLLARDRVEKARLKETTPNADLIERLAQLDHQVRKSLTVRQDKEDKDFLKRWRATQQPPQSHWWWYLDQKQESSQKERDFLWGFFAVLVFLITATLTADIIQRLWTHVPDNLAILGSLLTLLVTASPFTKNGRELMLMLLTRVPRLNAQHQSKVMTATALFALVIVAGVRFVYLPILANAYNSQGVAAIQRGQLTIAKQKLQRAIAINNDLAPSYYNLAAAYEKIARYDEAIAWYQQALDYDLDFAPAYNNLGRLYLLQNNPARAREILSAGLVVLKNASADEQTMLVTRYRLLTHLGQAYYEQEQFTLAAITLEEVIALEVSGELNSQFFASRPHYYLALTYEALARPAEDIIRQLEMALGYLNADDPVIWRTMINQQLEALREGETE